MTRHVLIMVAAALACSVGATSCEGKGTGTDVKAGGEPAAAEAKADKVKEAPAPEATCESAAENLVALLKPKLDKELAAMPEEQRAMAEQQMKAQLTVEAITAQCKQQNPGKEELECVTTAKTEEALQGCKQAPPPGAMPPGAVMPPGGPHGGVPPGAAAQPHGAPPPAAGP